MTNRIVFLDEIELSQFLHRPSGDMMRRLQSLKRDSYLPNERILVYMQGEIPWNLLAHLQRVIATLDITNCFVKLVSDHPSTQEQVKRVRDVYAHHDETVFEVSNDFFGLDLSVEVDKNYHALLNPSPTMCALPWRQLEIKPIGECRTCCVIDSPIRIQDNDPVYNINDVEKFSWQTLYFSKTMQLLREKFRQGQQPAECRTCWKNESSGASSARLDFIVQDPIAFFETDFEAESFHNLTHLDIKPGNLCNLSCRICNSSLSSSWAAEELSKVPRAEIKLHPAYNHNRLSRWSLDRDDFWKDTDSLKSQLRALWLSGGETFMIPGLSELFDRIENPEQVIITINTNGTISPEEYFDRWKKFKLIRLMVSIDDIGDRFEYQRAGSHWAQVQDVVNQINRERDSHLETTVICTVNVQNVLYLPELHQWFDNQNFDHLYFNPLLGPSWARLDQLTKAAQKLVIEKLEGYQFDRHQAQVDAIVKSVKSFPSRDGLEFCRRTKELDLLRNQDFSRAHREIAQAMGYLLYE